MDNNSSAQRAVPAWPVVRTLCERELVRFFRQKNRVFGALGQPIIFWLLFGAGLAGGVVTAIVGGASLITFPALLATGLPAIVANASNSVALTPANVIAAALFARFRSRHEPSFPDKLLSAMREGFGGHIEEKAEPRAGGPGAEESPA